MQTKWGIVGCSPIVCDYFLPRGFTPSDSADLVVIYDHNISLAKKLAETYKVKLAYSEDELFQGPCDIVLIASSPQEHKAQIIKAASARKHVFCIPPLTTCIDDAHQIFQVCSHFNIKLGMGFPLRFHEQHRKIKKLLTHEVLGELIYARFQISTNNKESIYSAQNQYLSHTSNLLHVQSQGIDLMEYFLGKITKVFCYQDISIQQHKNHELTLITCIFESGAKGILEICSGIPQQNIKNRMELYGINMSILGEETFHPDEKGKIAFLPESEEIQNLFQQKDDYLDIQMPGSPLNMYYVAIESFSRAVLFDAEPPVGRAIGLRNLQVLLACQESISKRKMIEVE